MSGSDPAPREVKVVGIAGWGRMGSMMGAHLLKAGWPVVAYDPGPAAAEAIEAAGAQRAEDLPELGARCDLVLVVVVDDDQVRDAIVGAAGLAQAVRPGTIVGICSTVRPATSVEVATAASAHGAYVVDMPLVGGERGAAAGTMTVMCGGPPDVVDACRGVLSAVANNVCRIGDIGSGQVAKIANNLLMWACLRADLEVLRLARASGVEPNTLRTFLAVGSGANQALADWAQHNPRWPKKDFEVAFDMAAETGVDLPFVRALVPLMEQTGVEDLRDLK